MFFFLSYFDVLTNFFVHVFTYHLFACMIEMIEMWLCVLEEGMVNQHHSDYVCTHVHLLSSVADHNECWEEVPWSQ